MDHGHELHFGVFLPPLAEAAGQVLAAATEAEVLGLDSVSLQDHPYQPAFLDTWTLLTAIALRTERVTVFPNVANLPLRPPAVLARSAASLDILTGGRVELGLGAGAFWDAIEAMGGPRRTPREAVDALEEAIGVLRALWRPGPTPRLDGVHHPLRGARSGPFPAHDIGIWLGAYKKRMLRLTGRLADGWLPSSAYAPPGALAGMNRVIDEAAADAGRDPRDIRRYYNVAGTFGSGGGFLEGPPAVWVEQLVELALTEGISGFLLVADPAGSTAVRRFAEEVVPAVREAVAAERQGGTRGGGPAAAGREALAGPGAVPLTPVPDRLGVQPTPAPQRRLSATAPWDEGSRPRSPEPYEDAHYTETGRTNGRHLIAIHDHLRQELTQVRDLVEQVARGHLDVAHARSIITTMTMRQNEWTLGTYCQSYCRVVATHHTIEDQAMFPRLRRADARLEPVLDRLEQEHHTIAGVLEEVDRALVRMVTDGGGAGPVQEAVDLLTDTLLSHLSYEERELVEPLARLDIGVI